MKRYSKLNTNDEEGIEDPIQSRVDGDFERSKSAAEKHQALTVYEKLFNENQRASKWKLDRNQWNLFTFNPKPYGYSGPISRKKTPTPTKTPIKMNVHSNQMSSRFKSKQPRRSLNFIRKETLTYPKYFNALSIESL